MNETSILRTASCPASPTSVANVELIFARIFLSFSIDSFQSVNTVLVGDDTTLHLQLTRGYFRKRLGHIAATYGDESNEPPQLVLYLVRPTKIIVSVLTYRLGRIGTVYLA